MNQASSTVKTPRRIDVFVSPALESVLRELPVNASFRFASDTIAQESQQMDEHQAVQRLAEHHEQVQKLLKGEKPTGTPHLFVLEPEALSAGLNTAQSTLQALASAQFNKATAVVALVPAQSERSPAGELTAQTLKDGVLRDLGFEALDGLAAIQAHFGVPVAPLEPEPEDQSDAAVLDVSMEKVGVLRRLFEAKQTATQGSATHQQTRQELETQGVKPHLWSEQDIKLVETDLKVSLHHDTHRLLTTVGAFAVNGFKGLSPDQVVAHTRQLRTERTELNDNFIVVAEEVFSDAPELTYLWYLDTTTGNAGLYVEGNVGLHVNHPTAIAVPHLNYSRVVYDAAKPHA